MIDVAAARRVWLRAVARPPRPARRPPASPDASSTSEELLPPSPCLLQTQAHSATLHTRSVRFMFSPLHFVMPCHGGRCTPLANAVSARARTHPVVVHEVPPASAARPPATHVPCFCDVSMSRCLLSRSRVNHGGQEACLTLRRQLPGPAPPASSLLLLPGCPCDAVTWARMMQAPHSISHGCCHTFGMPHPFDVSVPPPRACSGYVRVEEDSTGLLTGVRCQPHE